MRRLSIEMRLKDVLFPRSMLLDFLKFAAGELAKPDCLERGQIFPPSGSGQAFIVVNHQLKKQTRLFQPRDLQRLRRVELGLNDP